METVMERHAFLSTGATGRLWQYLPHDLLPNRYSVTVQVVIHSAAKLGG
jgi:hypothetical protein